MLQGVPSDATLTYTGSACSNAMLLVTAGATIRFININDGICVSPSRDLILINSPADVTVRHGDLTNGKDAISILDNSGNVFVRFNHIAGNSGYGILRTSGSGSGTVKAVANNIYNNRIGSQAECNNKGEVNHNFWGPGVSPTAAISRCTYTAGKRLGCRHSERCIARVLVLKQPRSRAEKTHISAGQLRSRAQLGRSSLLRIMEMAG